MRPGKPNADTQMVTRAAIVAYVVYGYEVVGGLKGE